MRTSFDPAKGARLLALACAVLGALAACAAPARAQAPARAGSASGTQETVAGPQQPAAAGARKAPATGSISGRVVGEGGEPLPDAAVNVRPRGVAPNLGGTPTLTADDEGNFVARGLAPGTYAVSAFLAGYVSDPEQVNAAQGYRLGDFVTVRLIRGGVITGTVTDASGAPLVAINVSAYRVRDHEGRPAPPVPALSAFPVQTDDRGVYRIYGLAPGVYVVAAGSSMGWAPLSPYEGDVPTFYPSTTRDAAAEITVRSGQEVVGIDIRHREERGRSVSGTLALPGPPPSDFGIGITLTYAGTGALAASAWANPQQTPPAFAFEGVADGDYEVQAQLNTREGLFSASPPQRVAVRGADVTGLRLALAPPASVSGTLVVEPPTEALRALPACKERAATMSAPEALVVARRDARAGAQPAGRVAQQREAAPDEAGAFTLRGLEPGAYRFEVRPPDENFYARPVQTPAAARPAAGAPAPAGPLNLAAGQQLAGLSVRLAPGAAGLAGRVVASDPAASFSPTGLRLHLVPAERERGDEPAHYAETSPAADGSFAFRSLAPGRYLLVARPLDAGEFPPRPLAWDADARARLRREAEAAALALDLQPCQRVTDFTLRHPHAPDKHD